MKIQNLSIIEKVELAQQIWDSLAADQDSITLTEPQKKLLNDRLNAFDADNDYGSNWQDVKSRIVG